MKPLHIHLLIVVFCVLVLKVEAQSSSPGPASSPAPPPPACVAPEFHQFDFWLGHWKVTNPKGVQVGTSEISRVSGGCAVREQWKATGGQEGTSLNYYDPSDHQWHQDWVGGDDTILHLHGVLKGNAMVLTDERPGAQSAIINRITFTPLSGAKVSQEWAVSKDQGKTWQISFLGIYEKVGD